ncbi:MAG: flagellar basal body P-ring formation chaperone FlgA [Rhodoferax sp.]|nr:flagellar basal body P-ring formation chaperone FlgA [Rhodoferax sp.]
MACTTLLYGVAGLAHAQGALAPNFEALAQDWLRDATHSAQSSGATALRMEVKVGNLDSRLRLAPCGNVEPYLPPGSRLWGRTRIGLRCIDGVSRWNVSLPVTVNAFGNAWVIKSPVQPGAVITEDDVVEAEVNWAEEHNPVIRDRALWVGQIATRVLTTGQTLRQGMVKPAQVFQAGAVVRVVAQGPGFQVSSDAQAMSAGVVGQVARVRMENGRVSSGVVLDMRTVKIDL